MIPSKPKPGFVRVLVTARNRTIQIREQRARDHAYMTKHGLTFIPEPIAPPVMTTPVAPPIPPELAEIKPTQPKNVKNGK